VIDLHCHILPGIDDGAADLEDSVGMALQAEADGIEVVCATPHVRDDHDVRLHELSRRVADLNDELTHRGIAVRVAPGGEVAEPIVSRLSDDELRAASLGGAARWILLEPAAGPLSDTLHATVEALAARGHDCVIAHPERHLAPDLAERLTALIARGALVQVTAALLAGGGGVAGMLELAGRGLIHLLGSDSHSARVGRPVALSAAFQRLEQITWLRPHLDWMAQEAPAAILAGEPLVPPFGPRP
jgi:protein-tyrosine phosphatase